ncbi:phospholipase D-like domain-containing protein [Calditerrivibrio sp.]|jgi:phosphatidylserine/phosphatidylglycerophosphate/cardiolipin synthase-like enzyme|uniref:phospholipase D-like domain-containing protein n=1 Tax=Calditerrivibrio sp. TaxID=2792612 RepID=UPI003D11C2AA
MKNAKASIHICNRLHAKFVVVDNKKAIVGSANFTTSGLSDMESGNIEAGVFYEEPEEVIKLSNIK